ncbi:MAG: T9SS type B sorting domain-containing protein [Bacteroidota bacterium]
MKTKLSLLIFLLSLNCFAQFSKTHYIPPISCSSNQIPQSQYLYISCPSVTPVNFRIIPLGGIAINGTVSRDNPFEFNIGSSNSQILADQSLVNQVLSDKGYVIEADDLVYASVRVAASFHAGSIVSKGLAALGTQFRIGGFLNLGAQAYGESHYTFASILATENNTTISFSDIKPGVSLVNNAGVGNLPPNIILNSGESYMIAVQGPTEANKDGLIGALISSDKPIAVNCGSMAGTNSPTSNLDFGIDQIVSIGSVDRPGKEYILVKGKGFDEIEKSLIIAHNDNTEVYINGNPLPSATLQAGDYLALDGTSFNSNNNLYINATKDVFVYQAIGGLGINGTPSYANQNMHFVPPLSCETPKTINNIPLINQVGNDPAYIATVCLVTKTGATLNFIINGNNYSLATLNTLGVTYDGPSTVSGNTNYETYVLNGLTGNVSVFSTESIYLSYYGSSANATYGGFYSGFTFEPEIAFNKINLTAVNCIPNVKLEVNSVTSFDQFQWYLNENPIAGAISNSYTPIVPGYYHVKATISACGKSLESDRIPVSDCPTDMDNDLANDNIDIDNDNDGVTNCTESFGNQIINTSVSGGIIPNSAISYSTTTTKSTPAETITGNPDGSFVTEINAGKQNYLTYNLTFSQPSNIGLEYPTTALVTDLINANAEYVINCDINKTVTVLNPDNQLLIDTNYDGIYESGVIQFSSFEIRFRLNGSIPLAAGTGTFKFLAYQVTNFKVTHKNLLDTAPNKSTFKFFAVCVSKDSDNDGNPNQTDTDSDNDGILDVIEAQSNNAVTISNIDTNGDGLDNAFDPGFTPVDTDSDGVSDYLDLDADNDGILDSVETIADTDTDGVKNYRDLDSDDDQCFDVKEAGFLDPDTDGLLGTSPVVINPINGQVTSGVGYTAPNSNYITSAPVTITTQPIDTTKCLEQSASFSIVTNAEPITWQISTDAGNNWSNLIDDVTYSGTTTNNLTITNLTTAMSGNLFRTKLNRAGNSCDFYSNNAKLTTYPLPVLKSGVRNVQCDDDTDGITTFNLRQKESELSTNFATETFDYFTTSTDAESNDVTVKIPNPLQYSNTTAFAQTIWVRVTNATNGCFEVVSLQLVASTSNAILNNYSANPIAVCDDYLDVINDDNDGISNFDLSQIVTDINALLPNPDYSFSFYKNYSDFLQETDASGNSLAITNLASYRNIGYPTTQTIWVRLEDSNTNDCVGSTSFKLIVEPRPIINMNTDGAANTHICSDDPLVYQTLTCGLPDNAILSDYTFEWYKDGLLLSDTTPTISVNQNGDYKVVVAFVAGQKCSRERNIKVEISNTAQIVGTPIIKDLIENNSISLTVTGNGNYVFALDDQYGPTQATGYFENIPPGIHTVYVIDLYGCAVLKYPFTILGFPKFFTPNGDGYHDYWNIIGTSTTFYPNTTIYVFDKYGRLLKEVSPLGDGWDGTFVGQQLPSDDYWYSAQLQDGRTAKGHFTLKR